LRGIIQKLAVLVLLVVGWSAASPTAGYAQGGATGAITGAVLDTGGGAIADADVQIFDTGTALLARRGCALREWSVQPREKLGFGLADRPAPPGLRSGRRLLCPAEKRVFRC